MIKEAAEEPTTMEAMQTEEEPNMSVITKGDMEKFMEETLKMETPKLEPPHKRHRGSDEISTRVAAIKDGNIDDYLFEQVGARLGEDSAPKFQAWFAQNYKGDSQSSADNNGERDNNGEPDNTASLSPR